ncbi:hypothetical protein SISNIDRAFT_471665 [Sistotremastrum niveocremeum HHB9708]|uniref:Uncharacterized protein n=1 Tax=Sistotremastrum niveocremeum HHB9708 TaxID=1314777 RepID=A0A164MCZ1_9AGAM|nr:hypothetical protein SISNIDRAFT_471665 [Sistotremastrum niveocremeum HHB9708]
MLLRHLDARQITLSQRPLSIREAGCSEAILWVPILQIWSEILLKGNEMARSQDWTVGMWYKIWLQRIMNVPGRKAVRIQLHATIHASGLLLGFSRELFAGGDGGPESKGWTGKIGYFEHVLHMTDVETMACHGSGGSGETGELWGLDGVDTEFMLGNLFGRDAIVLWWILINAVMVDVVKAQETDEPWQRVASEQGNQIEKPGTGRSKVRIMDGTDKGREYQVDKT